MTIEVAKPDFTLGRAFSRRMFVRTAALLTAGATFPFYSEHNLALAQLSKVGPLPPGAVKINSNENPLGPSAEAAQAIHDVVAKGGRYSYTKRTRSSRLSLKAKGSNRNTCFHSPARATRCIVSFWASRRLSGVTSWPIQAMKREPRRPITSGPKW